MWTHFFSLQVLANELHAVLPGTTILEVFTQRKNELLVSVGPAKDKPGNPADNRTLVISVDPAMNFLFMRNRANRARKNSVDVFSGAPGAHITDVSMHARERILYFDLSNDLQFCVQLFGTAASNVFLVDGHGLIQSSFKNSKRFGGNPFSFPRGENSAEILSDPASFSLEIRKTNSRSVFDSLKSAIPVLGSTFAREILHRLGIDERRQTHLLDDDACRNMHAGIKDLLGEIRRPTPTLYFGDYGPRVFSVIPLQHLSGMRAEHFASVNDAVRTHAAQSSRGHEIDVRKKDFIHKLKREHNRTIHALTATRQEIEGRAGEEHERIAKVLMANLHHLTKGTKLVELEDTFAPNKPLLRITLDPKLTPAQNAERYFGKMKRRRVAREDNENRVGALEQKQALIEKILLHLDYCQTSEQLDEFQKEHGATLQQWKILSPSEEAEQLPFRVFKTDGDLEVWVGKNSASNDLLTMKYARPNDLWFHVRGTGGSHVVLRVGTGKTQPSRQAILQTAGIAAYYSKMKNAHTVPVAYCARKYVRKPKGADAGTVTMQREKVIFVDPALPR